MEIFAETERLILRELLQADAEAMFEMDSDARVHRYLGNKHVKSVNQVKEAIRNIRQQYSDNGIGRWAAIEKSTGNFIGWAGLKLMTQETNHHVNYLDLGYRFAKRYWGNGYATESAKALLDYGFMKLKQQHIYAMTNVGNLESQHVLQKCGLKPEGTFSWEDETHLWFKISRHEWLNTKISCVEQLTDLHKEAIFKLWNEEYPARLKFTTLSDLASYLDNLHNQLHYFIHLGNKIIGWAFLFEREHETWFAIIIDSAFHRQGFGKAALHSLKLNGRVLNGWVIDHFDDLKINGEPYLSPLTFYKQHAFTVCDDTRLETEKLSAVKIKWEKQCNKEQEVTS